MLKNFNWEWGSTKHPIIGHAIIGAPISAAVTAYMAGFGGHWQASIGAGILAVLIGFTFQEWADQRAHDAIREHHMDLQKKAAVSSYVATPEVWHGWDWRDWLGGVAGAVVGSLFVVLVW